MIEKKRVLIIATGGTIAGNSHGTGYNSAVFTVEQLLTFVPQIAEIADIETAQFCNIGSQNMDFQIVQQLSEYVQKRIYEKSIHGVVILHGTDTMEESSYFLHLALNSSKPVVFTGSMVPASSPNSDGPQNIIDSIIVASSDLFNDCGVTICMNGTIHSARTVSKTHTTSIDTFLSTDNLILGQIQQQEISRLNSIFTKHTTNSMFHSIQKNSFPKTFIFYASIGVSEDHIRFAIEDDYRGVILAGVGNGNCSNNVIEYCKTLSEKGIAVVRCSRVPFGKVIRNLEIDDDSCGFIVSGDLSPQKSAILLSVALASGIHHTRLQEIFDQY